MSPRPRWWWRFCGRREPTRSRWRQNDWPDLIPSIEATLPPSIHIVPVYDRSATIVGSVQDVKKTLVIAFALVVLVIFSSWDVCGIRSYRWWRCRYRC